MKGLVPGLRIYVFQSHIDEAERKKTGTATARFLLSCFYTPSEIMEAGNLTGKNNRKGLDSDIIEATVVVRSKKFVVYALICSDNYFHFNNQE